MRHGNSQYAMDLDAAGAVEFFRGVVRGTHPGMEIQHDKARCMAVFFCPLDAGIQRGLHFFRRLIPAQIGDTIRCCRQRVQCLSAGILSGFLLRGSRLLVCRRLAAVCSQLLFACGLQFSACGIRRPGGRMRIRLCRHIPACKHDESAEQDGQHECQRKGYSKRCDALFAVCSLRICCLFMSAVSCHMQSIYETAGKHNLTFCGRFAYRTSSPMPSL